VDDEDYWDDRSDDYESDDLEEKDEWVLDCGDPNCCMNFGYHFRSECYTPEMYEAMVAEAESESPACTCTFDKGALFHLPDCPLRR
jgi:hypothetical protein